MAGQPLATAYVRVRPQVDRRAFQSETEKAAASAKLDKAGQKAGASFAGGFAKFATIGFAAGFAGLGLLKGFVSDAEDAAKTNQLLASTIKSTGDASKTTVGHLNDYANALMAQTGIQDDIIKSGDAMLLTFTGIKNEAGKGNDVFDQTTKILLDMTTAMTGGNVTQEAMRNQAIQLGKALNDPAKGLTALQRVGVTFTEGQQKQIKAMVKSGDTMGAQKVILRELNREFGGAAAAMATPSKRLGAALAGIGQNIGTALLPLVSQLAGFLTRSALPVLNRFSAWFTSQGVPAITRFAKQALPVVIGGVKIFWLGLQTLYRAFQKLPGWAKIAVLAITGIAVALQLASANPIIAIVGAIILLVGVVTKYWPQISRTIVAAWQATNRYAFAPLINFFTKTIPDTFKAFIRFIRIQFDTFELIIVTALSGMVHALAVAFGWIPFGLGNKLKAADKAAAAWVASIQQRLNSLKSPVVTVTLQVAGHGAVTTKVVGGAVQLPAGRLVFGGAAKGMRITAGTGPTADDVLVRASRGETIVSAAHSRMLAPVFSAAGVPGYAAGGFIGKIPGAMSWAAGRGTAYASAAGAKFAQLMFAAYKKAVPAVPGVGWNVTSWVLAAMAATMAPSSWLSALLTLVMKESGGNPRAWNPISVFGEHASGLFQTLPSTYAGFATVPGGIWNPVSNAVAGIRYIMARYGSPFNIPGLFGGRYVGYDRGGWLPPGLSMAWNGTGRPEPVGMGGNYYSITVNVPPTANAAAVGGQVVAAIQAYERGNGKRWRS